MNSLPPNADLRQINAHKSKINWGEVPALYHMLSNSASDLDELLTHGFDSGYKSILNKNNWNLQKLDGSKDAVGNITVKYKPKVALKHVYNEMGYQLHCYPVVEGEIAYHSLVDYPACPFMKWYPESMRQLFKVGSLPSFIIYTVKGGDEADYALVKHIHIRVVQLIELLEQDFNIVAIKGYTIAEFFKEVTKKGESTMMDDD